METEITRFRRSSLENRLVDTMSNDNDVSKVKEWANRYLPAEIIATSTAYIASHVTYSLTENETYAALAATHAGNLGYYGTILIKDCIKESKKLSKNRESQSLGKIVRNNASKMVGEFGLAFLLDSFLIRPFAIKYATEQLKESFGRFIGVTLGKLASEVAFYSIVIPSYEIVKKITKSGETK